MKTVLVTGGAGFVGSHLCERLINDGHKVISLDNYFTGLKDNHIKGVEYIEGHTKDIEKHIKEVPDIIYHLGEYSRVEQSVLEPDIVYDLNTLGTKSVIEFWKKNKCKLVYAGSSTRFGDDGATRYTSPYASTKADNADLVKETGEKENLEYSITYFYNVYGPRERSGVYGTVIEHFKRMYISGAPCAVVSPGTQRRNFTHVCDIVDGLILVGEKRQNDEYNLGSDDSYSIFEVANMFEFGDDIVMFPERTGNRMASKINKENISALGWNTKHSLPEYVSDFTKSKKRGKELEKRILVFSTTMHPIAGLAEDSLLELVKLLPDVHFDVVTTCFSKGAKRIKLPVENITLYRIGIGSRIDKFLLPVLGAIKGIKLEKDNNYLFTWSLMASYATLAASIFKRIKNKSLLVTLADHNLDDVSIVNRFFLRIMLSNTDQVYGTHGDQEKAASKTFGKTLPRNSLGEGDAFANAVRYAYADLIRNKS